MSRSWPRVISPEPTRSTLTTSAPIHARSCVHVGPDCTCVKSRMRTPSNALPITFSPALSPPEAALRAASPRGGERLGAALRRSFLLRGGIEARDAAAFGARLFVDDRVDQRGLARADRCFHRIAQLGRRRGQKAHATEGLHQLLVARALDEHQRRRIASSRGIHFV